MRATKWLLAMIAALALTAAATPAAAQLSEAQAKSAARKLAETGDELWARGDWASALDKFERAYGLVNAPTLAMRQAECLVKLGRLVEASEKYLSIGRRRLDAGAPDAFKAAVADALARGEALQAELPSLKITIQGEALEGAELTVDRKQVPAALWGVAWPIDPGEHRVTVVKGDRKASEEVTLQAKQTQQISLTLPPGAGEPAPAAKAEPKPAPADAQPAPEAKPGPVEPGGRDEPRQPDLAPAGTSIQPVLGWITVSLGAAGMVVGAVAGGLASSARSELDETCTDGRCPTAQTEDVDWYDQMRTVSAVGVWAGLGVAAAGVVIVLTAPGEPDPPEHKQARLQPWVSLGAAGLRGGF